MLSGIIWQQRSIEIAKPQSSLDGKRIMLYTMRRSGHGGKGEKPKRSELIRSARREPAIQARSLKVGEAYKCLVKLWRSARQTDSFFVDSAASTTVVVVSATVLRVDNHGLEQVPVWVNFFLQYVMALGHSAKDVRFRALMSAAWMKLELLCIDRQFFGKESS